MNITRTTLLKTIELEEGKLYSTINNRRCLLADTVPVLEVYENEYTVPIMGKGRQFKRLFYSLVLCKESEFTREVDIEYLKNVTAFDLTAKIQRSDGVFEKVEFRNLEPEDIQSDDEWVFNVEITYRMKKLFDI